MLLKSFILYTHLASSQQLSRSIWPFFFTENFGKNKMNNQLNILKCFRKKRAWYALLKSRLDECTEIHSKPQMDENVWFYSQVANTHTTDSWQTTLKSSAEKQEFGVFRSKTHYNLFFMISSLLNPQYPMPFLLHSIVLNESYGLTDNSH